MNWKYKVVRVQKQLPCRLEDTLNRLGNKGWELVTRTDVSGNTIGYHYHLIFKRRIRWWQYF